jgi:hypothetical protein
VALPRLDIDLHTASQQGQADSKPIVAREHGQVAEQIRQTLEIAAWYQIPVSGQRR